MVYCFSCGQMLVPGVGCAACTNAVPTARPAASERELPAGRPILTLVRTFPRISSVEPPPHAAA
jgi:hypothetical protein